MENFKNFKSLLYTVNDHNINDIALRLFRYQAQHNPIYASYVQKLRIDPNRVNKLSSIPYLPISFFKSHQLKTGLWKDETTFVSSGTSGSVTSTHHIADLQHYLDHAQRCFEFFFGSVDEFHFLALMPSYLERENSSLVAMINSFIKRDKSGHSGFYLYDHEKLKSDIEGLKESRKKIVLWGVSFALLDFGEKYKSDLKDCIVIETGGMKGRRSEITREELHQLLKKYFNVNSVYSEYGMTELLSQAYTRGENLFYPPPGMKVLVRDIVDPFDIGQIKQTGGLNVIDLANFQSVAFIETEDSGKVFADGSFEVLGRIDNSDVRGCNLMVE